MKQLDKEISKDIELNNAISQRDLINILYRTLYPVTAECTFFSSVHETYTKTDDVLDHKTNLNNFKRMEIICSVFSKHN